MVGAEQKARLGYWSRTIAAVVLVAGYLFLPLASNAFAAESDQRLPGGGFKPDVPGSGAYLGGWINPAGLPGGNGSAEIQQLPRFNAYVGGTVRILHVFASFTNPFPMTTMLAIDANGSIPMLSSGCLSLDQINAGQYDAAIASYAQSFVQFHKPAFLRWYWEMNANTSGHQQCGNDAPGFITAWQRIWTIFQQNGANNVAFVWCPLAHKPNERYYPGDSYVDWVCVDAFDHTHEGALAFQHAFGGFYRQWAARKPLVVGATGATAVDQYKFLQGVGQLAPTQFPLIKAIMYFDAPGDTANWSLSGNGLAAFRTLVHTPYFSGH